jgi:hypothetical protein
MKNHDFKLTRDDFARQLHESLRELYPDQVIQGDIIHKMIIESGTPGTDLMFPARDFADISNLDPKGLIMRLYNELKMEFEKNLHDKFLFEMTIDDNFIYFKTLEPESENEG